MPTRTLKIDGLTVEWFGHSTIGIYGEKILFIDAFSDVLTGDERKADLIICTHEHGDHFDDDAINRLVKANTSVIVKSGCDRRRISAKDITELDIGQVKSVDRIEIKAVHAYNVKRFRKPGQPFHPQGFGMGVVLKIEGVKFYYAGDTDFIAPMEKLDKENIDVAFLPIGGTYTMDVDEAVEAVMAIKPATVVPVHYNHLPGTEADPERFKKEVEKRSKTKVVIL